MSAMRESFADFEFGKESLIGLVKARILLSINKNDSILRL